MSIVPPRVSALPLVSVVIPVRDRALLLRRALISTLGQRMGDFEVIVVDDASSDRPGAVVESFGDARLRCLRLPANLGPARARNAGLNAARGRYVAFLDSDDEWLPEKLAAQCARMEKPGGPDLLVSGVVQRGARGDRQMPRRGTFPDERIASFLYVSNGFAQASGVIAPRSLARDTAFDPTLRQYEDHLFLIRAESLGARVEVDARPLAIQHVDERADRLGRRDDARRARAFLIASDGLLNEAEKRGFELRCLGAGLARSDPAAARRMALAALKKGGPLTGAALKLLLRAAAGERVYGAIGAAARRSRPI